MGLNLSGIDAELDALGEVARELDTWTAEQARELRTLSEIDAALNTLAAGMLEPDVAPKPRRIQTRSTPEPAPEAPARRPKSGEIELGEPVQRRAEPVSSELTLLDSDRPRSGSFELSDPDLRTERNAPAVVASPKAASQAEVAPISLELEPPDSYPQIELTPLAVDPVAQADAERKLGALLFTDEQAEPDTAVSFERDPDAEFDALFDEATHPSGIPMRGIVDSLVSDSDDDDDDRLSAEDLLSGLSAPAVRESDALTSALFSDFELGDETQVTDTNNLSADFDPFPSEEELGSSEFEIVLDQDGEAKDLVPSHPPDDSGAGGEKRPSFLGRLFGRKDDK